VRLTRLLRELLGLKDTRVVDAHFDSGADALVIEVKPTWRLPRCAGCGKRRSGYDTYRARRWRHIDLAGMKTLVEYDVRRVSCPRCGVRVEQVPWADFGSWFTRPFEDQVGYLAQRADQTTVATLMRVAWSTVGDIIQRVVERHGPADLLDDLTLIGVDELSYRRHHEYITVVVDHVRGRVVWARPGRNAATLRAFFDELGVERCAKLEAVTIDMSGAYKKAITEASPQAQVIIDRFHVQRLAHDALDQVRREEVRATVADVDRKRLKHTRWALQKNPWNLTQPERAKLADLQRTNRRIYRAYLLKEALAGVLDRRQVHVAETKLREWRGWAQRSRLAPFRRVARTITDHWDGIVAYLRSRLSNGRTEGLNGKMRTITRRAYGFHNATSLMSFIKLCCSGVKLSPVFQSPGSTH
jgi:transposase